MYDCNLVKEMQDFYETCFTQTVHEIEYKELKLESRTLGLILNGIKESIKVAEQFRVEERRNFLAVISDMRKQISGHDEEMN